jgi:hypothetical protein
MSAEKYINCPKCYAEKHKEYEKAYNLHMKDYGKVSIDTFKKQQENLKEMINQLQPYLQTLGVDTDLEIVDNKIKLTASGFCRKCEYGFDLVKEQAIE